MKKIWVLDPKIKWKTFKELQRKLVKESGPVPKEADRMYWELLRENKIYCWFASDMPNDMGIGLKIPKKYKKYKVYIIKSV